MLRRRKSESRIASAYRGFLRRSCYTAIVAAVTCKTAQTKPSPASDASAATARGVAESTAFGIPVSPPLCHPTAPPKSAPPGLIAFEFEDARLTADDRLMRVIYDSTGRPLSLVMTAMESMTKGQRATHVLSVSFLDDAAPSGFRVLHPERHDDNRIEQLPASAVAQARVLALWLWNHRCS